MTRQAMSPSGEPGDVVDPAGGASPSPPGHAGDSRDRLPAWARLADAIVILSIALAVIVLFFGGFRLSVLGLRVSVKSWWRVAAWAGGIALLRYAAVRRDPLPSRVMSGWRALRRSEAIWAVAPAFVVTRAAVLLVGLMAVYTIGYGPAGPPFRVSDSEVGNLLARFDTGWYLGIASRGYSAGSGGQQNIAFFPLYPFLMSFVGRLFGGHLIAAGFVISLAAFYGALVYVYLLGRLLLGREGPAVASVALLASYPFAIYFGLVYTESLFLLCAAGAIYHLIRGQPGPSAAWGLMAGLTRPNGFLLAVSLAVVVAARAWPASVPGRRWLLAPGADMEHAGRVGLRWADVAAVAAPIAGVVLYSAYVYRLTGDPLAWMSAQGAWNRQYGGVASLVSGPAQRLANHGLEGTVAAWPFDTLNAIAVAFAIALLWPVTRRYGLAFGLFVVANLLPALLVGGVVAVGRYTSVLFPLFLWLGERMPPRHAPYWFAIFGMGQGLAACLFFTWRQLF